MQVIRNSANVTGGNLNSKHFLYRALFFICCILAIIVAFYQYFAWQRKSHDFLIFSQSYTVATCLTWKNVPNTNSCPLEHSRYSWTIHGVWPSKTEDDYPSYCKKGRSAKFTVEELQPMRTELEERWPSVDGNNVKFWKHEWEKHGTCGMNLLQLNSQLKYFQQAMDWHREFSVEKFLANAGIYPNDMKAYKLSDIRAALKNKLNVDANVACKYDKRRKVYILIEIRICLNAHLSLIDCDDAGKNHCPKEDIYYPSTINFRRSTL